MVKVQYLEEDESGQLGEEGGDASGQPGLQDARLVGGDVGDHVVEAGSTVALATPTSTSTHTNTYSQESTMSQRLTTHCRHVV